MVDAPPQELKDALAEGRALIVCGAGVSMSATGGKAPGWASLIRDDLAEAVTQHSAAGKPWVASCEALLTSNEVEDWLNAADTIQSKLGGPSGGPWRAFFKQRLGKLSPSEPAILQALKRLSDAGNRIATTNYDHLISDAIDGQRADWTTPPRVIEALRREPPAVWHIHGELGLRALLLLPLELYDHGAFWERLAIARNACLVRGDHLRIGDDYFEYFVLPGGRD